MKNQLMLASAVAATLGSATAAASTYTLKLVAFREHTQGSFTQGNISSSTATWSYDDVTGVLSQTGGTFNIRFTITPATTLFRQSITGLIVGNGATAAAASFVCTEGNFGPGVGSSICGNYQFGDNFTNESSVTWGPGTSSARTIGGDDMAIGAPLTISSYDAFNTISWNGSTLIIGNAQCNPAYPGSANNCWSFSQPPPGYPYGYNTGYSLELQAIPVPAAVWLFGSAVGVLGWLRRSTV